MFARIRNRLTLRYALVMMLLMMAFIIVSSAGLLWILYQEERQDLRSFAAEEAREQAGIYKEKNLFFSYRQRKLRIPITVQRYFTMFSIPISSWLRPRSHRLPFAAVYCALSTIGTQPTEKLN